MYPRDPAQVTDDAPYNCGSTRIPSTVTICPASPLLCFQHFSASSTSLLPALYVSSCCFLFFPIPNYLPGMLAESLEGSCQPLCDMRPAFHYTRMPSPSMVTFTVLYEVCKVTFFQGKVLQYCTIIILGARSLALPYIPRPVLP